MAAVVVGLLVLALVTGTPQLVPLVVGMAVALVAAPYVAARRGAAAARGLVLHLHALPPVVEVGGRSHLQLSITNTTDARGAALALSPPGDRWERWEGWWPEGADLAAAQAASALTPRGHSWLAPPGRFLLPPAGPRATVTVTLPVPTDQRDVLLLPPQATWVTDPFGLFAANGPPAPPVAVVVHPPADPAAAWPDPRPGAADTEQRAPAVAAGAAPARHRSDQGELVGIRPYVPGDRLSLLHWPSRLRYGQWLVREFGPEQHPATHVALDDRTGVHRRADFDALLSAALGLVASALTDGRPVELVTLSGRRVPLAPDLDPAGGGPGTGLHRARLELAALQPTADPLDLATAAALVPAAAVVVTTVTGAAYLPSAVAGIPVLAVQAGGAGPVAGHLGAATGERR